MKLLPAEIVSSQLKTHDTRSPLAFTADAGVLYGVPVLVGLVTGLWGTVTLDISAILAAVAVYTALIFNLAFHVFDKSLSMRRDPFVSADANAIALVDQLRVNVNYTVLTGVVLTAALTASLFFDVPVSWPNALTEVLTRAWNGLIAASLTHLFFLSGMILKRFTALHDALKP